LFLIQYTNQALLIRRRSTHSNSAFALSALLIAVNDPEKAAAGYGNISRLKDQGIQVPEFGAVGKEIVLDRGSILLLHATDASGPTARRLTERGEGILAVKMTALDLN
jgi:hypothetical protein